MSDGLVTRRGTGDVHALVAAYVSGVGLTAAAEAAGMSKMTAWRRLQTPEVQEMVAEVEAERRASLVAWSRSMRALGDLVTDAVVRVLTDDPTPSTVARLASVVLPEVRHLAETADMGERLERLETAMGDQPAQLARVVAL